MLYEALGEAALDDTTLVTIGAFTATELPLLRQMLNKRIHSPLTSSAGRLFDGVASIIGLRQRMSYEGQAAMEMEYAAAGIPPTDATYNVPLPRPNPAGGDAHMVVDWVSMLLEIIDDQRRRVPSSVIAAKLHNTLVEAIVQVVRHAGERRVVLSGGCFQNRYLTERAVWRLTQEGYQPYWHQRVPPNDGGIALGQLFTASMRAQEPALSERKKDHVSGNTGKIGHDQ